MSYTVVHDQQYEDHRFENLRNEVKRHCKIGKVTRKFAKYRYSDLLKFAPANERIGSWPKLTNDWLLPLPGERKCSCKPGDTCGNAACPYGLWATSQTGYTSPTAIWLS
jgi:hypothetical protein